MKPVLIIAWLLLSTEPLVDNWWKEQDKLEQQARLQWKFRQVRDRIEDLAHRLNCAHAGGYLIRFRGVRYCIRTNRPTYHPEWRWI